MSDGFLSPRARLEAFPTFAEYCSSQTRDSLARLIWDHDHQRNVFGTYSGTVGDHALTIIASIAFASNESLRSDNARLAKELEEARKALEPFARYATVYDEAYGGMGIAPGDLEMTQLISSPFSIRDTFAVTLGDLRRAAAIRHKATVTTDDLPEGGQSGD